MCIRDRLAKWHAAVSEIGSVASKNTLPVPERKPVSLPESEESTDRWLEACLVDAPEIIGTAHTLARLKFAMLGIFDRLDAKAKALWLT